MFGLVHFIEKFPQKEYLKYIAIYSPNIKDVPNWARLLNIRILNSQKYLEEYIGVILNLENIYKTNILQVLLNIKTYDHIKFGEKVDYVIEKTKSI